MKILNLKFKNINSLSGDWEIDFTKPAFTNNGIFAIIGKTGAGKSSILDAIALALYGKTPRVEITGQSNEVMTRGATDCYAEIVFEIGGKKWKSAWKQERTRTGNLKPVQRQIADGADKICADQVIHCNSKIIEIVGLTFQQFTKVIMLAQGSFAAFLQAENKDKGELLEQITETEIYGEISQKVFERNKAEKEKLDKILVEIGAIQILTAEEMETLSREIAENEIQKKQIDGDLMLIEASKKWLADLDSLQNQLTEAKQKLPDLMQQTEFSQKEFEQKDAALKEAITVKEDTDKVLVGVRELDTQIAEKNKALDLILPTISDLTNTVNTLTQTFARQEETLKEKQQLLQQKQAWATTNVRYESLTGAFAAIENQQSLVDNLLNERDDVKNDFEKAKKEKQTRISILEQTQALFAEKEKAFSEKEQELIKKKTALWSILEGKERIVYQEKKETLFHLITQIKNLMEVEKDFFENKKKIETYHACIVSCENEAKKLAAMITADQTTMEVLKNQIQLVDENIKLTKTIQSLDDHRKSLIDGQPCPLCGAADHPFARGNEPKIGEKESELKRLKAQEQQLSLTVLQNEKALTKRTSEKENAQTNKVLAEKNSIENSSKRDAILKEIQLLNPDFTIPTDDNKLILLEEIQQREMQEYKQVDALIVKATESEQWIKKLQDIDIPQLLQAKQAIEKEKTAAETNKKLIEQQFDMLTIRLTESEKKYNEKNNELLKIFGGYGVTTIEALRKFLTDWNNTKKAIDELKEQINKVVNMQLLTNAEIESHHKQIAAKKQEKQRIETEKQTLATARHQLFGDKQAEEEEKRLRMNIEQAEKAKTEAEKIKTNVHTELAKNQAVIAEKEKELTGKQAEKKTEKTVEELQVEYIEKKPQSDLLSQNTGAKRQALVSNEDNLRKNRTKLDEKELQQQVCLQWASLNELIGQQDGKKYRNFAQALTFEYLIGLANRQLCNMSERYILKRVGDALNPFELSVIDKFQNCEERTAKNLSGGEKFIVSLSLALGLANMASKNMNIDTMFIDEGFGTLDSDYLDVALTALANLQNEGKLIGVISHLSELKERITTHIAVIPKGDGHSRIEM